MLDSDHDKTKRTNMIHFDLVTANKSLLNVVDGTLQDYQDISSS